MSVTEQVRRRLLNVSAFAFDDFDWLTKLSKQHPTYPTIFFGYITFIAIEHPQWTFWQILHEGRKNWKPPTLQ